MEFNWNAWSEKDRLTYLSSRALEQRIGEVINGTSSPKYLIIGIEESVGPQANLGKGGSENAFHSFCQKFLSMQSTKETDFSQVAIMGSISIENLPTSMTVVQKRETVEKLDDFIIAQMNKLLTPDTIPIIIGGGHNNAFPIIQALSSHHQSPLSVVNLDAHADYRPLEGRHSGNPFSYAFDSGSLSHYSVLHLQKRYNSQKTLDQLKRDGHFFTFHEDYIDNSRNFENDLIQVHQYFSNYPHTGIELDLDTIENMPSSAISCSGVSMHQARKYIRAFAQSKTVRYMHLPEGAPTNTHENNMVGKALAYLVTDFIEVHQKHNR